MNHVWYTALRWHTEEIPNPQTFALVWLLERFLLLFNSPSSHLWCRGSMSSFLGNPIVHTEKSVGKRDTFEELVVIWLPAGFPWGTFKLTEGIQFLVYNFEFFFHVPSLKIHSRPESSSSWLDMCCRSVLRRHLGFFNKMSWKKKSHLFSLWSHPLAALNGQTEFLKPPSPPSMYLSIQTLRIRNPGSNLFTINGLKKKKKDTVSFSSSQHRNPPTVSPLCGHPLSSLKGQDGRRQNSWRTHRRSPWWEKKRRRRAHRQPSARTVLPGRRSAGSTPHPEPSTWFQPLLKAAGGNEDAQRYWNS